MVQQMREMGNGWDLTCPFSEIGEICSNFDKKSPANGYLWVKFLI